MDPHSKMKLEVKTILQDDNNNEQNEMLKKNDQNKNQIGNLVSFNKDIYEIKCYDTIRQRHHSRTCNFINLHINSFIVNKLTYRVKMVDT